MSSDLIGQLKKLESLDQDEREMALEELVESNSILVSNALAILDAKEYSLHPITVESIAIQINSSNGSALDSIISYAEESPFSNIGRNCIIILGEVAYLQASRVDARIVPTLVRIAKDSLSRSDKYIQFTDCNSTFSACIHSLRESVRATPLVGEEDFMDTIFSTFYYSDQDFDDLLLMPILEIMYSYENDNLLLKLKKLIHEHSPKSDIHDRINDFLEGKETGDQWW